LRAASGADEGWQGWHEARIHQFIGGSDCIWHQTTLTNCYSPMLPQGLTTHDHQPIATANYPRLIRSK
jgi:hypothetical protein